MQSPERMKDYILISEVQWALEHQPGPAGSSTPFRLPLSHQFFFLSFFFKISYIRIFFIFQVFT